MGFFVVVGKLANCLTNLDSCFFSFRVMSKRLFMLVRHDSIVEIELKKGKKGRVKKAETTKCIKRELPK